MVLSRGRPGGRRGTVHPRVMYAYGKGVSQDDVAAHMWFSLAGARSSGDERDTYVGVRDSLATWMTPEQIAEAERLAREWKPAVEP